MLKAFSETISTGSSVPYEGASCEGALYQGTSYQETPSYWAKVRKPSTSEERKKWDRYIRNLLGFDPNNLQLTSIEVRKALEVTKKIGDPRKKLQEIYIHQYGLPQITKAWKAYFGFTPGITGQQKRILQLGWPKICGMPGTNLKFFKIPEKIFSEMSSPETSSPEAFSSNIQGQVRDYSELDSFFLTAANIRDLYAQYTRWMSSVVHTSEFGIGYKKIRDFDLARKKEDENWPRHSRQDMKKIAESYFHGESVSDDAKQLLLVGWSVFFKDAFPEVKRKLEEETKKKTIKIPKRFAIIPFGEYYHRDVGWY